MKNAIVISYRVLLLLVLGAKLLGIFIKYPAALHDILNAIMFSLIGIAYLVVGYIWDRRPVGMLMMVCGLFLIVMNFFRHVALDIIGIVCILVPLIIGARYYRRTEKARQ